MRISDWSSDVCSSDLKRNVKPIGLWIDPVEAHHKWELDIEEAQCAALDFPMIADPDARVSSLYDMIHPESDPTVTVRSVFIIDPSKKVRLMLTYPPSTGRNFVEILRAIDSLQLTDARSIATPVNRSEEHTSELQSLMRISYAVFCLK